jgi:glycogen debranching enzyme
MYGEHSAGRQQMLELGKTSLKLYLHAVRMYSSILMLAFTLLAVSNQSVAKRTTPVQKTDITITHDRSLGDWSELAMGEPSNLDDADQKQNQRARCVYIDGYGKPHADAGASGRLLPRLNDGLVPQHDDDPSTNVWFDTKGQSRILVDLGVSTDVSRINVYSWHSGALSPQQYEVWGTASDSPDAVASDLSMDWQRIGSVDTRMLGDGGMHGSSINATSGRIGHFRYLLFVIQANKPEWSRSGFLSEIDVYRFGKVLPAIRFQTRKPGTQTLTIGKLKITRPLENKVPYLVAGKKAYAYGSMDGTFPPAGRDNAQGGVWFPPRKALDRFTIQIDERGQPSIPLRGTNAFTHSFASSRFVFTRNDLTITREDFVPEDEPAFFSLITIRNDTGKVRSIDVHFNGEINLIPAWGTGLESPKKVVIEAKNGRIFGYSASEPSNGGIIFGSNLSPRHQRIQGNQGILTYSVILAPKQIQSLKFLIIGAPRTDISVAARRFTSLIAQSGNLLKAKTTNYNRSILGGVIFTCSDKAIEAAFLCAKANALMSVRDSRPDFVTPYLVAGFPVYPWLFGCDSCYSTTGIVAAGYPEAARGTLLCLLHYAEKEKRAAHEVVNNGKLLGTDHIQETPQLVLACWEHYLWTGDKAFLNRAFPVCRDIINNVLQVADADQDGYLEGPGLMEEGGMGPERLESVCYLYAAYLSLANMADALGKSGADDYRTSASELKLRFNRDWWNVSERMWANSLLTNQAGTMDNFWAVIFPQHVGIADLEKAKLALERIRNEWINSEWGYVAKWAPDIKGRGVGVVHNNIGALTAFMYGDTNTGTKLLQLSAKAPLEERMLGAFDETLPGGGDLIQLWSFGPYMEAVIRGLVGVEPTIGARGTAADARILNLYVQRPDSLSSYTLRDVTIGNDKWSVRWIRKGRVNEVTILHTSGKQRGRVALRLAGNRLRHFTLNNKPAHTRQESYLGTSTNVLDVGIDIGARAVIRFNE